MAQPPASVLDRIRKLIALTTSDSPGEARNAAMKACELIRTHSVALVLPSAAAPKSPGLWDFVRGWEHAYGRRPVDYPEDFGFTRAHTNPPPPPDPWRREAWPPSTPEPLDVAAGTCRRCKCWIHEGDPVCYSEAGRMKAFHADCYPNRV